jgi:hypothetical protein
MSTYRATPLTALPDYPASLLLLEKRGGGPMSELTVKDRIFIFYARIIQELLLNSNQERGM